MSETPTTPPPAQAPAQAPASWDDMFKGEDPTKVREALDNSRKWESRAKENKSAADKLAEIEAANMTEAQKAAERLKVAEDKASQAERRAARFEIASEFSLSGEDAKALEHVPSEDGMRAIAARLAAKAAQDKKQGNHVPREGNTPSASDTLDMQFARELFSGNP